VSECVVDLGLLTGEDDDDAIAAADAFCKARGLEAKPGTPGYDFAVAIEKVFRSAIDPDSSLEKPERFFGSQSEVRKGLDRDRINFLCSAQEVFQSRISPLKKSMSESEFVALINAAAATEDGNDYPFLTLPRSMLIDCLRFGAVLWSTSSPPKSITGSSASSESSAAPTAAAISPDSPSSAPLPSETP
jgi:hypothetical protein